MITSVGYSSDAELLEVEFTDGTVYEYYNVPAFVFERLLQAPSIGKFFHAEIRSSYANSKL